MNLFSLILATFLCNFGRCVDVSDTRKEDIENDIIAAEYYVGNKRTNKAFTIQERLKTWNVAGVSIAVIKDFEIEWADGYGHARPDQKVTMTRDTVLQVASVSKFVTAVAMMKLVESGEFDLDTNVNDYLTTWKVPNSEFTKSRNVTLRYIMSHTAGLNVPTFPGYSQGMDVPTVNEILRGVSPANTEPIHVGWLPGSKESYSGGGTTIEQLLITEYAHKKFNQTFDQYMQNEVLKPIGMVSSTFEARERSHLNEVATGHICRNNQAYEIEGYWHTYPEKAAAGMYSTASDIARFLIHIAHAYNGEFNTILKQNTVRQMLTVQLPSGRFGLGATLYGNKLQEDVWFGHEGSNKGYCLQAIANTRGNGAVVISNGDCFESSAEILVTEILRTILEVYACTPQSEIGELFPHRYLVSFLAEVTSPVANHKSPEIFEGNYRMESVHPDDLPLHDLYYITADTVTPGAPDACSFRLWKAADSDTEFLTDLWYKTLPRPVIQFLRGKLGKVIGMKIIYGESFVRYKRQEKEL